MDYILDSSFDIVLGPHDRFLYTEKTLKNKILQALFTDGMINKKRGYFMDINDSFLWRVFEQGRNDPNTIKFMISEIERSMSKLINLNYFDNYNVSYINNVFYIEVFADRESIIIDMPVEG